MSFSYYSLERTKNAIYNIKKYSKELTKDLETYLQNQVFNPAINGWYAEEAVIYMSGLKVNLEALSSEFAVAANTVIEKVARAYDRSLADAKRSEDENEKAIADSLWYICFTPNKQTKSTNPSSNDHDNKSLSYSYSFGGDRREYSYQKSSDISIKISLDGLASVDKSGDMVTGANTDFLEDVIYGINNLRNSLESNISTYQHYLYNSTTSSGSGMTSALGEFSVKMKEILNRFVTYLTSGLDGSKGTTTKLNEIIEKYTITIVNDVSDMVVASASEII